MADVRNSVLKESMGAPLKVTLDKAACATTWKEVSKYSDFFYRVKWQSPLGSKISKTPLGLCLV